MVAERDGGPGVSPRAAERVAHLATSISELAIPDGTRYHIATLTTELTMWRDFKAFLIKQNALALAIAVVIGAALNDVVKSIVDNIIMPVVAYATPGGNWRAATFNVGPVRFGVGPVASSVLNFLIVGLVAWRLSRMFLPREGEKPATKSCQFCRMGDLDPAASRCPHCTSQVV